MKSTAKNTLAYHGIVTFSKYVGNKKIKIAQTHNAGGAALFSFIADCLVGNIELAQAKKPSKICLVQCKQSEDAFTYDYTKVSGFITINDQPKIIDTLNESRVRYSFLVTRDQLVDINNIDDLGLGLYTKSATANDIEDFIAFCEIDATSKEALAALPNTALVVDWELIISNGL